MQKIGKASSIELNIDQLVLEGFPSRDRYRLSNAIQQGLDRIIRERGIPDSLRENRRIGQINLDSINMQSNQRPEKLGQQVARSIYNSLNTSRNRDYTTINRL
jgi:hypothetical protein